MKKIFYILTPVVDTQTYTCDKTAQILTPTVTEEYKKSWGNLNKSYGLLSMQCPGCDTTVLQNVANGGNWGKYTRDLPVLFLTTIYKSIIVLLEKKKTLSLKFCHFAVPLNFKPLALIN